MNGLYALPFKGNRLVTGWQLSGILSAYDGVPLNANVGFDRADFSSGNSPRPNYVAGCNPYAGAHTVNEWFNPQCFTLEPVGTL